MVVKVTNADFGGIWFFFKRKPRALKKKVAAKYAAFRTASNLAAVKNLLAKLEEADNKANRHDAALRLIALAPCTSVAQSKRIIETLRKFGYPEFVLQFLDGIPEKLASRRELLIYKAATLYNSGNTTKSRELFYQTLISSNGLTMSVNDYNILNNSTDVGGILSELIVDLNVSKVSCNMLLLAFVIAIHRKDQRAVKDLVELTYANPYDLDSVLLYQIGRAYRLTGDLEKAAKTIFHALELAPENPTVAAQALDIARLCPSDNWIDAAIERGEILLPAQEDKKIARQLVMALSRLYPRLEDADIALERLARLAAFEDDLPAGYLAIAKSQSALGDHEAAFETLENFATKNNVVASVVYDMAGTLVGRNKLSEAVSLINCRIPQTEQTAATFAMIGHIYAWSGDTNSARPWLIKALKKSPNQSSALADMSLCFELDGQYSMAMTYANQAVLRLAVTPPRSTIEIQLMQLARMQRRMIFLSHMVGNEPLARTLQKELMSASPVVLPSGAPQWFGDELLGRSVLVLADLGIGDEIRYTSVFDRILTDAKDVVLSCDPRLQTLLERSFPTATIVPVLREFPGILKRREDNRKLAVNVPMRKIMSDDLIVASQDCDLSMRARHFFESECLDRSQPFQSSTKPTLKPDPKRSNQYRATLKKAAAGRKVIGLSWRGGRRTYNRDPHYFELPQWEALMSDPQWCFVNLQYAVEEQELEWLRAKLGDRFIEFPDLDLFDDMEGVAALCSCVDAVVAICTSVLELACAVGADCLYLMRSPQATHAIRLSGLADCYGTYQDAVWFSCRILPRFDKSDVELVHEGYAYLSAHLATKDA